MSEPALYSRLELRIRDFEKKMDQAVKVAARGTTQIDNRARRTSRSVEANANRMGQAMASATAPLNRMAERLGSLGVGMTGLGPAGLAAAAGIGAMTAGLTVGMSAGAESERLFNRLSAVFRVTGNAAGLTATEVDAFARSIERATGIAANEVMSAAAALGTYTNIAGRQFKDIIELSTNMVATYGGNLREWTDKIARAVDDPVQGFTALRKAGFALTDAQLELVTSMRNVGDVAGYQAEMLRILSEGLGGVAAAENKGLTGSFNRAKNAAVSFLEAMAQWGVIRAPVEGTLTGIAERLEHVVDVAAKLKTMEISSKVVALNAELVAIEDQIKGIESGATNVRKIERDAILGRMRTERDRLSTEIDTLIARGRAEADDIAAAAAGEKAGQAAAATELIRDRATEISNALKGFESNQEKLARFRDELEQTRSDLTKSLEHGADAGVVESAIADAEKLYDRQVAGITRVMDAEARRAAKAAERIDEYGREVRSVEESIIALEREAEIIGLSARERDVARTMLELETAARRAGIKDIDAYAEANLRLANRVADASEKVREATDKQEQANALQREFGQLATSSISGLIDGTRTLNDVLADTVKRLADLVLQSALLGDGPLAGLMGTSSGGGLIGALTKGFADGGYTGPGGKNEPAGVVHRGEFVFSKAAVQKAGVGNLEAMHRNLKGFASGGFVGRAPRLPAIPSARAQSGKSEIHIHNNAGAQIRTEERSDGMGGKRIDVFVDELVGQKMATRGTASNRAVRATTGAKPNLIRR